MGAPHGADACAWAIVGDQWLKHDVYYLDILGLGLGQRHNCTTQRGNSGKVTFVTPYRVYPCQTIVSRLFALKPSDSGVGWGEREAPAHMFNPP